MIDFNSTESYTRRSAATTTMTMPASREAAASFNTRSRWTVDSPFATSNATLGANGRSPADVWNTAPRSRLRAAIVFVRPPRYGN